VIAILRKSISKNLCRFSKIRTAEVQYTPEKRLENPVKVLFGKFYNQKPHSFFIKATTCQWIPKG
jgi:hypothetical protein